MKFLKIFLLVILAIFFIFFSFVYMLGVGVDRTLLNIDYYENIVEEYNIFENLHQNLRDEFLVETQESPVDKETKLVNEALVKTFSPEWIEEQSLIILEDVILYVKGDKEEIDTKINLSEKEDKYKEALIQGFSDLDYINNDIEGLNPEALASEILAEMDFMQEDIYIGEVVEEEAPEIMEFLDSAKMIRGYFPIIAYVTMGIVLVIMCLLATLPGGFNWYGASMLIAGAKLFAILFLSNHFINSSMIQEVGDIPLEAGVVASVISRTTSQIMVIPLVYGAIGILLIIIGTLLKKAKKKRTEDVLEDYKVS